MKLAIIAALLLSTTPVEKNTDIQVEVALVSIVAEQSIVVLQSKEPPIRYMPIWIGEIEAMNIQMRIQRQLPPRPFTLHLLESIMASANIKMEKVRVDKLIGGVFIGSITLRQGKRVWKIDARPSDGIGLAVGAGVPIWIDKDVFQRASVAKEEVDK